MTLRPKNVREILTTVQNADFDIEFGNGFDLQSGRAGARGELGSGRRRQDNVMSAGRERQTGFEKPTFAAAP